MTPFDVAWNFLKAYGDPDDPTPSLGRELSDEDKHFASRTGGLPATPERRFRNIHGQMEQAAANTAGGLQGGQDAPLTVGQASTLDEAHFGALGRPQPEGRGDAPAPAHPDMNYPDPGRAPHEHATSHEAPMPAEPITPGGWPQMQGPPSEGEMSALYDAPWTEGMKWPRPPAPEQEPQPEPATEQPQATGPMSSRDERLDAQLQEILGRSTARAADQHSLNEARRVAVRDARQAQRQGRR